MSLELNIYQIRVQQKAIVDSNQPFSNKGVEHAAVVMRELLLKAQRSVYIFARDFDCSFYGKPELLDALESFLRQNDSVLKIGLEISSISDNATLRALHSKFPSKLEIAHFSNLNPLDLNHYCIVDDKAYRLETDHEARKAKVCFNDPVFASRHSQMFLNIFHAAQKIDLGKLFNTSNLNPPN